MARRKKKKKSSAHTEAAPPQHTWQADLGIAGRGLLMGAADSVPGVSGGTVALIVGIYGRLVAAIAHFDTTFLGHVKARRFAEAARHVDLRFLVVLFAGILAALLTCARLVTYLLEHHHVATLAAFLGLILASGVLVAGRVSDWNFSRALMFLLAFAAAFAFTWSTANADAPAGDKDATVSIGTLYLFGCGMIGICAMILPGLSGSFILLVLGAYGTIMGMVSSITKGDISWQLMGGLAAFGAGCAVGILAFSKILKWLLTRFEATTMAALCGIMLGASCAVWPFRAVTLDEKGHPRFGPLEWPAEGELWPAVLVGGLAMAVVWLADWTAHRLTGKTEKEGV